MISLQLFLTVASLLGPALATPSEPSKTRYPRQNSGPVVDLGYERYEGVSNTTTGLNTFLGIRYARDPSGVNRWQEPKAPLQNRGKVIPALEFPQRCPQAQNAPPVPSTNYTSTEDCLYLSVLSPTKARNLPVFVYIHGGGYGEGQGNFDLTSIINNNNNSFVGVVIQYRLGAFGFLSSDEVARFGTPNAGILDQRFSLAWVQKYISKFGGDPNRVTVSGESAGGGSVLHLVTANGGTEGTKYFQQAAVQSPGVQFQYDYNAFVPSQSYYAFAAAVGCYNDEPYGNKTGTIFECLVSKSTDVLQQANAKVSPSGSYGTWAFQPVTDGKLIRDIPSRQLAQGKVNGLRILSGQNANEGAFFVTPTITTEDEFVAYLRQTFPLFDNKTISQVLEHYPTINNGGDKYATTGTGGVGATALDVSQFAVGQQQRAYNLYAEVTFVCPSYWLAEAFTMARSGGYKVSISSTTYATDTLQYQFSAPPALHAYDVPAFFGTPFPFYVGPDLFTAFQTIFGNYITIGDPSITSAIANGARNSSSAVNPTSRWPKFSLNNPQQINLNETGGVLQSYNFFLDVNTTYYADPGRENAITLVNAATWEGGRGARCEFLRSIGPILPL